jgi:ribose transport system substrate-binding protein
MTRNTHAASFLLTVAAMLVASLAFAGSGSSARTVSSAEAKPVRVAFFASSLANTYVPAQVQGAKASARKRGAATTVFDAVYDASKQLTQVQDAITSGKFDAFVISAIDGNALVPQIKKAIAAGIKVACISAPCGPDLTSLKPQVANLTVHVGHSFPASGRLMGKQIVAACGTRDPCKVVFVPGLYSYPADKIRRDALHATLDRYQAIEIVSEQEGKYSAESARVAMQNILQAHRDVNVVATTGDQMAFGIEQAIKAAGVNGKVRIIGNGASALGVSAVRQGRWYATLVLLPYTEGRVATDHVVRAARGVVGLSTSVDVERLSPIGPVVTKATAGRFKAEWRG